jgi:hypothetical protein
MNQDVKIIQNAGKCAKCGTIIISKSRYDYVGCGCGSISLDGGHEYVRLGYGEEGDFISLYLDENSTSEEIHEKLVWGTRGIDGKGEVEYKPLSELDTSHLQAILKTQTQISELYKNAIRTELRRRKIFDFLN